MAHETEYVENPDTPKYRKRAIGPYTLFFSARRPADEVPVKAVYSRETATRSRLKKYAGYVCVTTGFGPCNSGPRSSLR